MNKNLFALLTVLVLTSLVLSACGPAATPAPAPRSPRLLNRRKPRLLSPRKLRLLSPRKRPRRLLLRQAESYTT